MFSVSFFKSWENLYCKSRPRIAQKPFTETSCFAALAANHTFVQNSEEFFPFQYPSRQVSWIFAAKLNPVTFKLLSKIQCDTTSHPEVYLDLGNEFCLDCPQIQAIHIKLTGYLLCGKHRIILYHTGYSSCKASWRKQKVIQFVQKKSLHSYSLSTTYSYN